MAFCKCVSEEFVRKSLIASPFTTFGERAARLTILAKLAILAIFCQFCQISSSIGIDTKGGTVAILAILANLTNSAILAIFYQFRQISSSIGFGTTWVNIGDFGEFDKIGNFGVILPISSN